MTVTPDNSPEVRRHFVGASEIAALLHCHPFKTCQDLFLEKTGRTEDRPASQNMRFGNHLEDAMLNWFAVEYLNSTKPPIYKQWRLGHAHSVATYDGIIVDGTYKRRRFAAAPIDIKVIGRSGPLPYHEKFGRGGSDEIPDHIFYQIQQQLHLLHISEKFKPDDGFVGVLDLQGRADILYRIPYLPDIGQLLIQAASTFFRQFVLTDTMPDETHDFLGINF